MKRKVYIETSVISYLTARPSKTILGAAHQQLTQAWWEKRFEYNLFVSQSVWQECAAGNPDAAEKRLAALEGLDILLVTEEMIALAEALINQRLIPAKAIEDSLHIANPVIQEGIAEYLEKQGLFLPIICTPEELIGGNNDE